MSNAKCTSYRNVLDTTEVVENVPNNLFSDIPMVQEFNPYIYLGEDKITKNNVICPIDNLISSTLNPNANPFFIENIDQIYLCEQLLSHENCVSSNTSDNVEALSI